MARKETSFTNYDGKVESEVEDIVNAEWDDIRRNAMDGDYRRKSVLDSIESEIHNHIDQLIDLSEAADILEQCDNEENDSSYWEHIEDPIEAVGVKAFYSFKNDVRKELGRQLEEKLEELKVEQETFLEENLQKELDEQQEYADELEEKINQLIADAEGHEHDDEIDELNGKLQEVLDRVTALEEKVSDQETLIDNIQNAIDTI